MLARGSQSFTRHPQTNHTYLYSPATGHHRRWFEILQCMCEFDLQATVMMCRQTFRLCKDSPN